MIAKGSIVSRVIAFASLGSVALRRPLMSAGLKPFMTKGRRGDGGVGPVVRGFAPVPQGVDLAFWFTFAGYPLVHDPEPRRDLDMASYGVVRMLPGGPGTGYNGLGWEPKLAFRALAEAVTGDGRGPFSLPVR